MSQLPSSSIAINTLLQRLVIVVFWPNYKYDYKYKRSRSKYEYKYEYFQKFYDKYEYKYEYKPNTQWRSYVEGQDCFASYRI